jgi:hypothetical protein
MDSGNDNDGHIMSLVCSWKEYAGKFVMRYSNGCIIFWRDGMLPKGSSLVFNAIYSL